MNWDKTGGNWKQAKGKIKEQWAKLTDDHLEAISGKRDRLVGKVQECYGIHKDVAEQQVKDWEAINHDVFAETSAEVKKHTGIARQ
jgi:uncharacterized protein YjbJ (UPF0337 family)